LAYYTGVVFEVHEAGGKERAIAGGGRYDNLIELFGGPPTPAVGFGMGDVVLSLVISERVGVLEGKELLEKLSERGASLRPDVFVISNGTPECDEAVAKLTASLRTPKITAVPAFHARHTSKSTKNIGKLLQEANGSHARFAAIIESANQDATEGEVTLKNLDTREERKIPIAELAHAISSSR
jgi:histidyl-tRNA synthetase